MSFASRLKALDRHGSEAPDAALLEEEQQRIAAALVYVRDRGNLDGFPGSRNERLAIMATAIRRGVVAWDPRGERFTITRRGARLLRRPPQGAARCLAAGGWPSLRDRFERHPHAMIAASLAIAVWMGVAAPFALGSFKLAPVDGGRDRAERPALSAPSADQAGATDAAPQAGTASTAGVALAAASAPASAPAEDVGINHPDPTSGAAMPRPTSASGAAGVKSEPQAAGNPSRLTAHASVVSEPPGLVQPEPNVALAAASARGAEPPQAQARPATHRRNRDARAPRSPSTVALQPDTGWWQAFSAGPMASAYASEDTERRGAVPIRPLRLHAGMPPDTGKRRNRVDEADAGRRRSARPAPWPGLDFGWPFH